MPRLRTAQRQAPALEPLEARQLLSWFSRWLDGAVDRLSDRTREAVVQVGKFAGTVKTPVVAVVGDGFSDEYAGRFPARNWAELLVASGQANLGEYSEAPRPDTRGTGFALNWATAGASSDQAVEQQLPGLLDQLRTGNVDVVVVMAGSSDFQHFLEHDAQALSTRPGAIASRLRDLRQNLDSNLAEIIREAKLADPDVQVVVATLPDLTDLPGYRPAWVSESDRGDRVLAQLDRAVDTVNSEIRARAHGQTRVAVADLARQLNPRLRGTGLLRLGPQTIDLASQGTDYHQFLLPDGLHPGTVGQALIANNIVSASNTLLRGRFQTLGASQILAMASLVDTDP